MLINNSKFTKKMPEKRKFLIAGICVVSLFGFLTLFTVDSQNQTLLFDKIINDERIFVKVYVIFGDLIITLILFSL